MLAAKYDMQRACHDQMVNYAHSESETGKLRARDKPVLRRRQRRDARLTMYVMENCDLGAHAPIVARPGVTRGLRRVPSELAARNEPVAQREERALLVLRQVLEAEEREEAAQVRLHGVYGEEEVRGDLARSWPAS